MDLLLWRHAEAEPARPGQTDLERRLTHHGEAQARRMAHWLKKRRARCEIADDANHAPHTTLADELHLIVSPATRCQQTAQALTNTYTTANALKPSAVIDDILPLIHPHQRSSQNPRQHNTLLLVGHQPWLGQLAARLLSGDANPQHAAEWEIKKAAVWWFSLRISDDHNFQQVRLRCVMPPEMTG
ncbi:MAG: histidine phosphatase family protein [Sterolibacterium sp.]|jgi:phosphohistidine phosphatase|nr:histidine phosphatase family protein [Sterolibacterium sp.]